MLSSVFFRSRVLRALLGLTIACLGFATAADEVAIYTFDDEPAEVSANSGVLVLDQSGMNQNGTLYSGAELFKEGDDGALQLNGGTGFAKMILRKTRFDTAPFSVEFNILLDSLKDGMVMGKKLAEEPDAAGWVVETANKAQEIHFTFSDGQQSDALSVPLENPQEWSHVVMVRDGKTVTVYVNGQLAGSKTSPVFGKDLQSPGDYFYLGKILGKFRSIHGKLDEVIIRNGSLTAEEVEKAYRAAKDKNIKKKTSLAPQADERRSTNQVPSALVLHYRFDSDAGAIAKDLSGNDNNGKIAHAQWLQEAGRGFLRFGEKFSSLDIGNPKSLQFSGDLSYEIRVRLNRALDPKTDAANIYIFGDYPKPVRLRFGWQFYDNFFAAYGDTKGVAFVPIDPRDMGAAWSQFAVVFEYPRARVYRDGKLIRDQLMPFPSTENLTSPKFLAGIPEAALSHANAPAAVSSAPVDISEFRLYKRALTETEIAAHAADNKAASAVETRVTLEPDWYEGKLAVRFISKGQDLSGRTAEISLFRDEKKVGSQAVPCSDVSGNKSHRFAAVAEFALADLKDHKIGAEVAVSGAETVSTAATLQKPDWIQTKAGFSDIPPKPWTPVKAETTGGNTHLAVWGRDYVFGSDPFPVSIGSGERALLASPISLKGSAAGKTLAWEPGQVTLENVSPVEATLRQTQKSGPLSLKVESSIGYDGYLIFDCEVQAREDTTLDYLALEIPLHSQYAALCAASYVYEKNPAVSMSESHWGAVKGDLDFRFAPSIWLGDNDRGLTWQSESDEFWHNADPQKAIQIQPRGETAMFRANFIDKPLRLERGQTLRYKFALLATPVKPMLRDAWDLRVMRSGPYGKEFDLPEKKIGDVPQLKYIADAGVRNMYWHIATENWPWPISKRKDIQDATRKLIDAAHAAGLKMNHYAFHIRFPLGVEEFQIYGRNIAQLPFKVSAWGNAAGQGIDTPRPGPYAFAATTQLAVQYCPKSPAARDACVHALDLRMKEFGDDGVYLDGTSQVMPCSNREHGCGYAGADGKTLPTYPVFANHEFIKRIYTVVKTNNPEGMVDLHYWSPNPAQAAFGDITFTGEQWYQLKNTGSQYASEALPLDRFRSMFMGRQVGTPVDLMSYRIGSTRQLGAISLLHDVPVRVNQGGAALESLVNPPAATGNSDGQRRATEDVEYFKLITSLWKIRDAFGMKDAEKLFYWDNADYVRVAPADCYATLFKHPENGTLAIISNLSRERRDVKVGLNLGKLGLSREKCEAFNPLTNESLAMGANGELTVPLDSEDYTYIWIRPKHEN